MTVTISFDSYVERLATGERLVAREIAELASSPDILAVGMLADTLRRRIHGSRASFLRVAESTFDGFDEGAVPARAREIRLGGSPASLQSAVDVVTRGVATGRTVRGLTWADVERLAVNGNVTAVLSALKAAGLEGLNAIALDVVSNIESVIERMSGAGFSDVRLTIDKGPASDRPTLFLSAAALQDRFNCIRALNPLPMTLGAFRPTTGYEDVKMVALARLAAPNISSIQVDWPRYGPKLAQVALSFGADDIDGVSGSDAAPEGRRRAALEEIQRNIEAAGFQPVERDGRFTMLA